MWGTSVYWPQKCPKKLTFQGVIRSVDAVEDFLVNALARPSEGVERLFFATSKFLATGYRSFVSTFTKSVTS